MTKKAICFYFEIAEGGMEQHYGGIFWDDDRCEYLEEEDFKKYNIVITDFNSNGCPLFGYAVIKPECA